ncbi:MAG: glutamate-5-semialdehyde dehydrogenase [Prevotella sp.]|nr:glutamate-5-semialdehyde dehydrogenase [Prevotella sp.]
MTFNKEYRQLLRRDMTIAERILWKRLRNKQLGGLRFRRQHGFGDYVMDFYCPVLKLCIEIDGDIHQLSDVRLKDEIRTKFLEDNGIRVLRFSNEEVYNNIDEVLNRIIDFIDMNEWKLRYQRKERSTNCSDPHPPNLGGLFAQAKQASKHLALISDEQRNDILNAVADAIIEQKEMLLEANAKDLARMDKSNPLYDRLQLTEQRLADIASDMRNVASLPSPLGHITKEKTLPNGLHLRRISVPFGVIGMIYEARPNVTFDVFSLCFKSGNACVLKGGKDADNSNRAAVALIHDVLKNKGQDARLSTFDPRPFITLLPATHEATAELLNAVGYVDLCIPRGGKKLIEFVRDTARIPVIETGAGVVHCYFDKDGDLTIGKAIVNNAKTRRVSVCNALDTLLVHKDRLDDLPELVMPLSEKNVYLYPDRLAYAALEGKYPSPMGRGQEEGDLYDTEFMDYKMNVVVVDSLDAALEHIACHGSGHSESIITENCETADRFRKMVDAACVYVNAPTSFTDGAQFGLGAEIGISTQKLGPRGPMALEEITTYKWLIDGHGQTRP